MAASNSTADDLIAELKRDADKGELLLWASARGLSADVEELVRTGADPSVKDKHGRTAVHYAASSGHADILEYLSTKGVDMDAEDNVGRGALHYAAAGGHRECLVVLLAKGCWRDAPDAVDDSPLHLAARRGSMGAVRALAEAGAKLILVNKRSLTPFAEAVLAGRVAAAEYLGDRAEGGLGAALAATYRAVPLLHLAAGMGQAAAVEWLVKQGRDVSAVAPDQQGYSVLHAAALSGDPDTVQALLKLGADPLSQTSEGRLPLEVVPKAAPRRAPPPPPPPGALAPPPEEAGASAIAAAAAEVQERVRSARRAFKALARAAAEQGGVAVEQGVAARRVWGTALAAADAAAAAEERAEEEAEDAEGPAAAFLRQFSAAPHEQQVAKVESYARMEEAALREALPHLGAGAQAAIAALRQAHGMLELFGAIAGLRGDEEFQSDIRDPRVRDALQDVKRTNDLQRYEDAAAVMSVASKFKRLHAITRKAGGLKVTIDDLRADLKGNDPEGTAAKLAEVRMTVVACANNAVKAVLESAMAAVPERTRNRAASRAASQAGGSAAPSATKPRQRRGTAAKADAGSPQAAPPSGLVAGGGTVAESESADGGQQEAEEAADGEGAMPEGLTEEAARAYRAWRVANKTRVDKLRAAATSAWIATQPQGDDDIGYVDRFAKKFEEEAAKVAGKSGGRLAAWVGEELAQSLTHTFKALVMTLLGFALMWCFGLMPHQQTKTLLSRQALLEAAGRAQAAAAEAEATRLRLEGLDAP